MKVINKTYIDNSRFMEFIDELATQITEMNFGADTWEWVEPDETSFERDLKERTQVFSSEAQEYYNEMYGEYEMMANNIMGVYSDNELNKIK
jgi:hypothetical protein